MANTINSYTNVFGQTVSTASIVSDMIADLQTRVNKGESRLTDVNVGSELRNLLEVNSNGIYRLLYENDALAKQLFVKYATKGYLDDIGEPLGIYRRDGNRANGGVVIKISSPLSVDYTIYAGARILSKKTGNRYILQYDVTIPAGNTWATGTVVAEGYGAEYNCQADELTAWDTEQLLRSDVTVTNDTAFTNGSYDEDDESYRRRILKAMRSGNFGSVPYYEANVESFSGVHDVQFVKPEKMNAIAPNRHTVLNSGNQTVQCNNCTAVCLVNAIGNVEPSATTLKLINDFLVNQSNILCGHEFHVQASVNEPYYFKVNYYVENGANVTEDEIVECIETVLYGGTYEGKDTIYYDGLGIGETLYKSQIIDALENMNGIHHIERVTLLKYHMDLSVLRQLERWINTYHLYGYTNSTFTYSNILDFPDAEDTDYQNYKGNYPLNAVWRNISTVGSDEPQGTYELVVDGYYFFKRKDNQLAGDNNIGETYLSTQDAKSWLWGEKNFDSITPNMDSTIKLGYLTQKDSTNPHKIYAKKLEVNN